MAWYGCKGQKKTMHRIKVSVHRLVENSGVEPLTFPQWRDALPSFN